MLINPLTPLADANAGGLLLRSLLCSAYLWSGVTKLYEFNATVTHFANAFKLKMPRAAVTITILVQLIGSAMFITGWMAWLAAIALAAFTIAATIIVYPFWTMTGVTRRRNIETFLEHVGLSVAFLLLASPSWVS